MVGLIVYDHIYTVTPSLRELIARCDISLAGSETFRVSTESWDPHLLRFLKHQHQLWKLWSLYK